MYDVNLHLYKIICRKSENEYLRFDKNKYKYQIVNFHGTEESEPTITSRVRNKYTLKSLSTLLK